MGAGMSVGVDMGVEVAVSVFADGRYASDWLGEFVRVYSQSHVLQVCAALSVDDLLELARRRADHTPAHAHAHTCTHAFIHMHAACAPCACMHTRTLKRGMLTSQIRAHMHACILADMHTHTHTRKNARYRA